MATNLPSGYSVSSPIQPTELYYADVTQRISNHLPEHSKIRKLKHSVGQTLINAVYGQPLEELESVLETDLRASFAVTYPLDDLDLLSKAEIPEWVDISQASARVNHVPNSSFEIRSNGARLPDGWRKQGTVTVVDGLEGRNAVRLSMVPYGRSAIFQEIPLRILAREKWTASVWYKIPANGLTAPASDFSLRVRVFHIDGTVSQLDEILDATTDGAWRRASLSFSFSKESTTISIEVLAVDVPASFSFSSYTLDVDCFQLERGELATPWRPDVLDALPYAPVEIPLPLFLGGEAHAHYVDNLEDFYSRSIPTRAEYLGDEEGSYEAVTSAGVVEISDYFKKTWRFTFQVQDGAIQKIGEDVPGDYFPPYDIAARRHDGYLERLSGALVEAITFFAGYLWAVVLEPDMNGSTVRTVHVIDPRTPHPEPSYLQSKASIAIPADVPLGASIVRVEFKNEDRQHLYLSTIDTQFTLRLRYDLFTIDPETRLLFLREDHEEVMIF